MDQAGNAERLLEESLGQVGSDAWGWLSMHSVAQCLAKLAAHKGPQKDCAGGSP